MGKLFTGIGVITKVRVDYYRIIDRVDKGSKVHKKDMKIQFFNDIKKEVIEEDINENS